MAATDTDKYYVENNLFFEQVRRLLDENKEIRIPLKGSSMFPFLQHADHIVLKRATISDLKLGKIVLGIWNEVYILHRIVGKGKRTNVIKLAGDGNLVQVEKINLSDIVAVVVRAYRADKELNINSGFCLFSGLIWYRLRFMRRVYFKIKRMLLERR
ncbi:hypothetical protein ACR777_09275 [Sphingobacterium spiritivorum]|uniref:hypothetical protein n=1 Tax=Sphingobacterium spiritivorum TaxID=258 RepID=UPI003DA6993B